MSNVHLNILIQLAKVDGVVVQEEIDLINEIGKAHGMTEEQISSCFEEQHELSDLKGLSDDEKFEYVYSLVQLMKIDGRLYDEEVLFELMLKIYSDPHMSADKNEIKKKIQSYLTK